MAGFLAILFLFVVIALIIIAVKTVRIVPQATVLVIEKLGRFSRVADSGLHILIPFFDRPRSVYWTGVRPGLIQIDLREQFTDLPLQPVITKDNVTIAVDSIVYWQITDPIKAVYEVGDLTGGIMQLTLTAMRNVIGELELDHTLSSRETINTKLRLILDEATHRWGVKVTRVEVRNINPPEDVRVTMEKQMTAERNRRALVLQADGERQASITRAEGEKQSAITRAEGEKQSAILRAEGDAQARVLRAQGEAEAIQKVFDAIHAGDADAQVLAYQYIQALPTIANGTANKVWVVPAELTKAMDNLGSAFLRPPGAAPADNALEPEAERPAVEG